MRIKKFIKRIKENPDKEILYLMDIKKTYG